MKNRLFSAILFSFCGFVTSAFAVMDIPNLQPKVDASFWNNVLDKTWDGLKKRNIEPYENGVGAGLVHRPKSEYPGDAVSEAVGYGMLVALYANDQETFNKIWSAANKEMWNGRYYDWHLLPSGKKETGAATDAEEDIILSLIFADKLVQAGKWQPYTDPSDKSYMSHAKMMMGKMWETRQITSKGTLAPGADWGGDNFVNVGYFSPAWYKIFAKYDSDHDWNKVVDRSYEIIANSPGYALGLVPDWMQPDGSPTGSLGYNAYFDARAFFKDAIRILWRVAIDAIWFDEPRAKTFLSNSMQFLNSIGGAEAANFFQMDGSLLPAEDVWEDMMGGTITRKRREHSPLTISMWATVAMAVGSDEDKKAFSLEMAKFYDKDADYFGLSVDPSGMEEDTLHNEMYFEQFLGWFGTSLMSGVFSNIDEDLSNPKENLVGITTELTAKPDNIHFAQNNRSNLNVVCNGNVALFSTNEYAKFDIYNPYGKKLVSLQGTSVQWTAKNKGVFLVKMKDSHNNSFTRRFVIQ